MTPIYDNFSKMFLLKRNQSNFLQNKNFQIQQYGKKKQYISLNDIKYNDSILPHLGREIITNKKKY